MTRRLVTWPLRTRYRPVRLPIQTVRWCLRMSNTASVAKHRDLPSPVGKETKTSLPSRNSRTALSWSLVAAAYPRVSKACLMASFTSSTATPLTSSLGISRIDARRTPLVITRSDASFSGNLIGQNDIVLQCQAFRLNVPDHLSSPIKNGGRKWTGDETRTFLPLAPPAFTRNGLAGQTNAKWYIFAQTYYIHNTKTKQYHTPLSDIQTIQTIQTTTTL